MPSRKRILNLCLLIVSCFALCHFGCPGEADWKPPKLNPGEENTMEVTRLYSTAPGWQMDSVVKDGYGIVMFVACHIDSNAEYVGRPSIVAWITNGAYSDDGTECKIYMGKEKIPHWKKDDTLLFSCPSVCGMYGRYHPKLELYMNAWFYDTVGWGIDPILVKTLTDPDYTLYGRTSDCPPEDQQDSNDIVTTGYTGIIMLCGDERYGIDGFGTYMNGETLDYPLAYPITVQVLIDGNPQNGEQVKLKITPVTSDRAGFVNVGDADEITGYTQENTIGGSNCAGKEIIPGTFKAPIRLKKDKPGLVEVVAEWLNPPTGAIRTKDTFYITSVSSQEELDNVVEGITDDAKYFYEKDKRGIIPGDGLWGTYTPSAGTAIKMDNDYNVKNIRVELDWVADLGSSENKIQLSFSDIEYIFSELNRIYNHVGIKVDPVIDLEAVGPTNSPINKDYQPTSVASRMEFCYNGITLNSWDGTTLQTHVQKEAYEDNPQNGETDIDLILALTRGNNLLGRYDGNGTAEQVYHYVQRRIHVVLLPGMLSGSPQTLARTYGYGAYNGQEGKYGAAQLASGRIPHTPASEDNERTAFPWHEGDQAWEYQRYLDLTGICVFTGALPLPSKIPANGWSTCEGHNGYCKIIAMIIAHEIGHAIGLTDMKSDCYKNEVMFWNYGGQITTDEVASQVPYYCKTFKTILPTAEGAGYLINLRKVLCREMTTFEW